MWAFAVEALGECAVRDDVEPPPLGGTGVSVQMKGGGYLPDGPLRHCRCPAYSPAVRER